MAKVPPSTRWDAEKRAARIRDYLTSLAAWQQEVVDAYQARDWQTLGYRSWTEYVTSEFGDIAEQLTPEQRNLAIKTMAAKTMSTRAIASAVGVNQSTVSRAITAGKTAEVEVMRDASPPGLERTCELLKVTPNQVAEGQHVLRHGSSELIEAVEVGSLSIEDAIRETGVPFSPRRDKVTGTDGKNYPVLAPCKPNRPALPAQFRRRTADAFKAASALQGLLGDDRFKANRESIADLCAAELRWTCEVLSDLLAELFPPDVVDGAA